MTAIAITGSSVFSPNGSTDQGFWESLVDGADRRSPWPHRALEIYPVDNVIAIPEETWATLSDTHGTTRSKRMADFLARSALRDAGLPVDGAGRVGCALGTTTACAELMELATLDAAGEGAGGSLEDADLVPRDGLAWQGPTLTLSTACSSGLLAPALAADMIKSGEAEAMVAGGMDVLLEYTICGFNSLRVATQETCRPFSSERKGVILSEGGACFCLEPLEAAHARQAQVQAVILGYGISCDGGHPTAPSVAGIGRAIRQALASAQVSPVEISGVIAHGTGTPTNDKVEIEAMRDVFGDVPLPPVTSVKSAIGHAQGGAGAISLLAALLSLKHGELPGITHLGEVDPALGAVSVSARPTPLEGSCLMVNAFGFGGNNCVMIVADERFLAHRRQQA